MAKDQAVSPVARSRTPKPRPTAGGAPARAEEHAPKKPFNLVQFSREVRAEARKITWPSRRETWITTVMVIIMVLVASTFLWVVDFGLSNAVTWLLKTVGA